MKRLALALLTLAITAPLALSSTSLASGIDYNNIISDPVFDNTGTMTASQINTFLNSFPNSCISPKNHFGAPDVTGYNPSQGYLYGGKVTAGTIIYHAAQAYDMNPQVLLATMQKEQSLVTGSAGCYPTTPNPNNTVRSTTSCTKVIEHNPPQDGDTPANQITTSLCTNACPHDGGCINIAVGYGCPYYCYVKDEGFSKQIIRAAWLFSFDRHRSEGLNEWHIQKSAWDNSDDLSFCYTGPMANTGGKKVYRCPSETSLNGTNDDPYLPYSGKYTYSKTQVTIANGATAAQYHYTPFTHGPYLFYTTWTNTLGFGDTHYTVSGSIKDYYNSGSVKTTLGQPRENQSKTSNGGWKQCFENGCIVGSYKTGYWMVKGSIGDYYWDNAGPSGKMGLPLSNESGAGNNRYYQKFQGGYIAGRYDTGYWGVRGSIGKAFSSSDINLLGVPLGIESAIGKGVWKQQFDNGYMVGSYSTGYWISMGDVRSYWLSIGGVNSRLGLPVNSVTQVDSDSYKQAFQNGVILGSTNTGYWDVKGYIYPSYKSLGEEKSSLGLPLANEKSQTNGVWSQQYQNGYMVGNAGHYYESSGPIRDYWLSLGKWTGKMGLPTGPVLGSYTKWQHFDNGVIIVNPKDNSAWESKGTIREIWGSLGYQTGKLGFPTGPEKHNPTTDIWSQTYEHGTIETLHGKKYKVTYT